MTTVGRYQLRPLNMPSSGRPVDASVVRSNDNLLRIKLDAHDADGTIHVQSSTLANRPAFGEAGRFWITSDTLQTWYDTGSAWVELGGGGAPFPNDPNTFPGTPSVDDEEWEGSETLAERGWVVEQNDFTTRAVINGDAGPSYISAHSPPSTAASVLAAYRLLSTGPSTGNLSVTFDCSSVYPTTLSMTFRCGLRRVASPGFLAKTGSIQNNGSQNAVVGNTFSAVNTITTTGTVNLGSGLAKGYVHVQRLSGGVCELYYSVDGVSWIRTADIGAGADSTAYDAVWFRIGLVLTGTGQRLTVSNDWIRVNRLFL